MSNIHSSFWMEDSALKRLSSKNELDPMELAQYQRSIGKFVRILTKEHIPVTFRTQGDSYTDGDKIIISSTISEKNFDSTVGLALHEGSHVLLTDFDFLENFQSEVERVLKEKSDLSDLDAVEWADHLTDNRNIFHQLINYVEDRRIDHYVYSNSPGYKGYYQAMYDRYFNDKVIDKAVKSEKYTDVTIESYMFRIINFLNENTWFDALPDLERIHDLIFDNIADMDSTDDAILTSFKIYRIIKNNVDEAESNQNQENDKKCDKEKESGDGSTSDSSNSTTGDHSEKDGMNSSISGEGDSTQESDDTGGGSAGDDESDENNDSDSENGSGSNSESNDDNSDSETGNDSESNSEESKEEDSENESGEDEDKETDRPELTERQENDVLPKKIERQKKFLDGETQKASVNKGTKEMADALSEVGAIEKEVSFEEKGYYNDTVTKTNVVVIKGFSDAAFDVFDSIKRNKKRVDSNDDYNSDFNGLQNEVNAGFRLGKRLGKKLQIRNRERTTTYNRKKKGKLDKRRIHALGAGQENVFNQYVTEKHDDAFIHLSIDGSGSMHRADKFSNSIKSAVAIAQMADMTNIEIEISIRYTENFGGSDKLHGSSGTPRPVVWVVYDSRKDSLHTIRKNFKYLRSVGSTPEGLCFESIMDQLPVGNDALKTYFINYSDGMPGFSNPDENVRYNGEPAFNHTRKQVDNMKKMGYNVLSYFISEGGSTRNSDAFKKMYGNSASFVDPTNLTQLVRTLQKMFMEK